MWVSKFAQNTSPAQHEPPHHKLIDLSHESELKTCQRPRGQGHKGRRTSAVEPVCVEADLGFRVELLEQQEEAQRREAQHPEGAVTCCTV